MSYGSKSITTASTIIVNANERRKSLIITNYSNSVVFIGPDSSITTANAIPLYEYEKMSKDKIPEGYLGDIYGIVNAGTAEVRYWEHTQ